MIVAVSIGVRHDPLVAPNFRQWMPHAIHPLIESGILLASIAAVLLNVFFNGARGDTPSCYQCRTPSRRALTQSPSPSSPDVPRAPRSPLPTPQGFAPWATLIAAHKPFIYWKDPT